MTSVLRLLPALLLGACAALDPAPDPSPEPAPSPAVAEAPEPPPVQLGELHVDVLDLEDLQQLEAAGWSFGAVMARIDTAAPPSAPARRLDALYAQSAAYRALADHLAEDIDALNDGIHRDLVVELAEAKKYPAGNVGRRMDTRWLRSLDAHFGLAGVVQRIDRRDLHREPTCGEVRFVYRLAYDLTWERADAVGSRLPVNLNVVYIPTETDCSKWARAWAQPPGTQGVLDPAALKLDRIEVNLQAVRFPAGFETEFGGQAAYLLEVLQVDVAADATVAVRRLPLESTPDVAKLRADPALRDALTTWIADNAADIDQGTYRLPDHFLADRAVSWSTLGVNRLVNRPFSALYPPEDRAGLPQPPEGARQVRSVAGLIDRLDNGTCTGCHQAGTSAGFHLLGPDDPAEVGVTNRLAQVVSPHLAEERRRRRMKTLSLANTGTYDRFRDHSLAPTFGMKGYVDVPANQPCLPESAGGALTPRAQWRCAQDTGPTSCVVVAHDPLVAVNWGQCTPDSIEGVRAGMACRTAEVESRVLTRRYSDAVYGQHGYADKVVQKQRFDLPEDKTFAADAHNCRPPLLGVPLGRAYRRCSEAERALSGVRTDVGGLSPEICGVVGGSAFDKCVEEDFHVCMESIVGRGMVAACDAGHPCREDHVCQAIPYALNGVPTEEGHALAEQGVGFCTPTYFLFQLRIDGHPVPRLAQSD